MSHRQYCEFIEEVCKACGIPFSESMYETCNLLIGDIPVTLAHGGPMNDGNLLVFCDFGSPPEKDRASALEHVLEANIFLLGNKSPYFAINPETKHVLLVAQISLVSLAPEELLSTLRMYASAALQWRETHILRDAVESAGQAGASPMSSAST